MERILEALLLVVLIISMVACTQAPATLSPTIAQGSILPTFTATSSSTLTPISTPTFTPEPTATNTPTNTPTFTPTRTPISKEEAQQILDTFKMMIRIQVNAQMLHVIAEQVRDKKISGFIEGIYNMALISLVDDVEKGKASIKPLSYMEEFWQSALESHDATKKILSDWFNKKILSGAVVERTTPVLVSIDKVLSDTESMLAARYGFDPEFLRSQRDEILRTTKELFATPTPNK